MMVAVAKQVAEKRYRESYGLYFEDFEVGDVYEHGRGRTIPEIENIQFSLLTMNRHPLHCIASFAERSEFNKPLVNSGLTVAIRARDERHRHQPEGPCQPGLKGNQPARDAVP